MSRTASSRPVRRAAPVAPARPAALASMTRRAVARALLEMQGWEAPSRVGDLVRAQMGPGDTSAIARLFYADPKPNARVGGFTPDAYLYGSEFTRVSTRRVQQQRLNEYADSLDAQISVIASSNNARAINDRDAAAA